MSWYGIVILVFTGVMLVFAILTWAGIVPKKVKERIPLKRIFKFDALGIVAIALIVTTIYLVVAGREIPEFLRYILPMVIIFLFFRD